MVFFLLLEVFKTFVMKIVIYYNSDKICSNNKCLRKSVDTNSQHILPMVTQPQKTCEVYELIVFKHFTVIW